MGGDIVYIVSKNAFFAGPNNVAYGASKADQAHQVRLLAAELGAVRDPGQRRQPRRRRPRLGDLRQGLGRRPGPDVRHPRGQARRVLRPADAAQARGAPGACRGRGLRPDRRGPQPDDRAPHPRRRGRRGGLPPVTGTARRGRRPRRVERAGDGRAGRPERAGADRGPPLPERAGPAARRAPLGRPAAVSRGPRPACARRPRADAAVAWSASGSTRGRSTTACSTRPGACSATRTTIATTGRRRRSRRSTQVVAAGGRSTRGPGSSSCRSTPSTSWRRRGARPAFDAARTMLLIPDLIGYWLTGVPRSPSVTNASTTGLLDVHAATWDRS